MKVVLSIDPIRFPLTGIGRYTYELARQLKQQPLIEQLHYLSRRSIVHDLPVPSQHAASSPFQVSSSLGQVILKNPVLVEAYRLVNSLARRNALRDYSDCVFHGTNFYLPPFAGPSVCTIHDLSVYTRADCHPPERVKFMRKEIALCKRPAAPH